jgi:hypothetical protein
MSTQLFSLHDAMTFMHSRVQSTTKASVNDHMDLFHYMVIRLKVSTNALAWRGYMNMIHVRMFPKIQLLLLQSNSELMSQPLHLVKLTPTHPPLHFYLGSSCHIMQYARITSIIGARQSGHFPTPWSNSLAHFEQVHICPHLRQCRGYCLESIFEINSTTKNT